MRPICATSLPRKRCWKTSERMVKTMGIVRDLTGQRFGRLTVLERAGSKRSGATWLCICDCGETKIVESHNLVSGNTKSCGCYMRQRQSESNKTHGRSGTRLHRIWKAMHTRCYNEKFFAFKHYGGRGIRICDEWLQDFPAFERWAVSHGYRDDLTIDRIDANGNYCPDNCRWVTMAEQNQNKRVANGYKIKEDI